MVWYGGGGGGGGAASVAAAAAAVIVVVLYWWLEGKFTEQTICKLHNADVRATFRKGVTNDTLPSMYTTEVFCGKIMRLKTFFGERSLCHRQFSYLQ